MKVHFIDGRICDTFSIAESNGMIYFTLKIYFDRENEEFSVWVDSISKNEFIEGLKIFLERGNVQTDKLKIEKTRMGIRIFLTKPCLDNLSMRWTHIEWIITKEKDEKNFLRMIREITTE